MDCDSIEHGDPMLAMPPLECIQEQGFALVSMRVGEVSVLQNATKLLQGVSNPTWNNISLNAIKSNNKVTQMFKACEVRNRTNMSELEETMSQVLMGGYHRLSCSGSGVDWATSFLSRTAPAAL